MELTGKMRLADFDVLGQAESGAWRGEGGSPQEKRNSWEQKDGGWYILNRAGGSKMKIRVQVTAAWIPGASVNIECNDV
jgi:hypothetical protein